MIADQTGEAWLGNRWLYTQTRFYDAVAARRPNARVRAPRIVARS